MLCQERWLYEGAVQVRWPFLLRKEITELGNLRCRLHAGPSYCTDLITLFPLPLLQPLFNLHPTNLLCCSVAQLCLTLRPRGRQHFRLPCPSPTPEVCSNSCPRVKNPPAVQETWVRSLGWEDPLEKEMATHSSILAWRISWREDPGRLQSMGSKRVRHDRATSLNFLTYD